MKLFSQKQKPTSFAPVLISTKGLSKEEIKEITYTINHFAVTAYDALFIISKLLWVNIDWKSLNKLTLVKCESFTAKIVNWGILLSAKK